MRICFACTSAITARSLYGGFFDYLIARGHEITLLVGEPFAHPTVKTVTVPMKRPPSIKDSLSLVRLLFFFIGNRFDVVHTSTPKAGLLATLAARLTGHRVIYLVRGRAYESMRGLPRILMEALEWVACRTATVVVPVSRHLERSLPCARGKLRFLGGSSNGVAVFAFTRSAEVRNRAAALRRQLGLDDRPVVLMLGRLTISKGVKEGVKAFEEAGVGQLLIAGPYGEREPIDGEIIQSIKPYHKLGFVEDTPAVHALANVFLFPTLREGFGNVVLEAAVSGVPTIAFDIPGPAESVVHERTGLLVRNIDEMAAAIRLLVVKSSYRQRLGRNARQRAVKEFANEVIWARTHELLLAVAGGTEVQRDEARGVSHQNVAQP